MTRVLKVLTQGVILGLILPGAAFAQSFEEALTAAYLNNPTLLSDRARQRATDESVPQALSGWRPTVIVSANLGKGSVDSSSSPGSNNISPRGYSTTITQPLYRGGRTVAETSQAENTVQAGNAQLLATEQAVMLGAAVAYMNVVRDQSVLDLNAANEQVLRRQLQATEDRFRVGDITRTDVAQAEARLAKAIADKIMADGNLQASRANFQNFVGFLPGKLKFPKAISNLPKSMQEAVEKAVAFNPNVVAADYTSRAAKDAIDVARSALLPNLSLVGEFSQGWEQSTQGMRTTNAQGNFVVSVPLYQGGSEYSLIRQQKQTASQRRIQVDQSRRDAQENAMQGWEALKSAQAQIKAFSSQIKAAEIALDGVQREAQVGARTVLDVLNAEQELLDARVSLVLSQRDEMVAAVQLKAAVGRLTADGMSLRVDVYDPSVHYNRVRGKWIGTGAGPEDAPNAERRGG